MKTKHIFLVTILLTLTVYNGFSQSTETGIASFYNDKFEGRATASGEVFSQSKLTAAHKTLPFKTKIKVTNLSNNRSVIVTINDRGPFVEGRILDLSKKAAIKLDFVDKGVAKIKLEVIGGK